MKTTLTAFRCLLVFTLLLGVAYPLTVMVLGGFLSPIRSHGSLFKEGDRVLGSELIGQKFSQNKYFWGRPSAADYVPLSSSASQRSGTDQKLKALVAERKAQFKTDSDLLWASGSGLDPHVSLEGIKLQKERVMKDRNLSEAQMDALISKVSEEPFLGFMGQARVNVLELNMLLDK